MTYFENGFKSTFDEVIKNLGLEKQKDALEKHWDRSCENCREDIFFLDEKFIEVSNNYLCFPDTVLSAFNKTVDLINSNKYLKILAWHLHQVLFVYGDNKNVQELFADWPCLETSMGELSDMFAAVVFASGTNNVLNYYREKGIPEAVAKDTLDDLLRWINVHYKKTGKLGFSEYGWLYCHFTGNLFRLGRLQFQPYVFKDKIVVYKNKTNNKILVLSKAGVKFRQDEQVDGTSGIFDVDGAWVSQFIRKDGKIFANPISENAECSKEMVEILKDEWSIVFDENDTVLNVHIHEGGKLDHNICVESYNKALEFFKKYFPESNFKAFTCFSWLLDVQLKKVLDSNSNIVKFLNDFYPFPVYSPKEAQMYERVFGNYIENACELPESTYLQKSIKEYILAGNYMRNGAGFILISQ